MRANFLFYSIKAQKENTTLQNKPKDKDKGNKHSKSATEMNFSKLPATPEILAYSQSSIF